MLPKSAPLGGALRIVAEGVSPRFAYATHIQSRVAAKEFSIGNRAICCTNAELDRNGNHHRTSFCRRFAALSRFGKSGDTGLTP